jgi:hypothetical protein
MSLAVKKWIKKSLLGLYDINDFFYSVKNADTDENIAIDDNFPVREIPLKIKIVLKTTSRDTIDIIFDCTTRMIPFEPPVVVITGLDKNDIPALCMTENKRSMLFEGDDWFPGYTLDKLVLIIKQLL